MKQSSLRFTHRGTKTSEVARARKHVPLLEGFAAKTSQDWSRAQQRQTLDLFKRVAIGVPAYKRYLKDNHIRPDAIKAPSDLATIPPATKANYLRHYPYKELFWNGSLRTPHVLTATSGSTGSPTYFGRSHEVDDHSSLIHELFYRSSSLELNKSTLVVVCFGMGVWIGGVITYEAFDLLGRRGYPISVITPGINKTEIFKILKDLAPEYDQLILAGYPPFLKDIIDEAATHGVTFENHKVALILAAEAFTEDFRDYIARKANVKNPLTDTMNIYGSADIGTMAFETPLAILVRRLARDTDALFNDLFRGTMKTPTLAQYIPEFVSFEAPNGEVLLTGDSAMPLIRYSIGDHGGVYSFKEVAERCKAHGIDLEQEIRKVGITTHILKLPFVYVYERIDLATTLYGLQIYPETVRQVLLDKRFASHMTGKIALATKYDHNQDQYLEINIEARSGKDIGKVLQAELLTEIVKNLREKNSEFRELSEFLGARAEPKLVFWPYEDPLYFKPGIKQQWVVRPS